MHVDHRRGSIEIDMIVVEWLFPSRLPVAALICDGPRHGLGMSCSGDTSAGGVCQASTQRVGVTATAKINFRVRNSSLLLHPTTLQNNEPPTTRQIPPAQARQTR